MAPLKTEFTFSFPRYVVDMAIGKAAMQRKREVRKVCGGYYHAPAPGRVKGWGFYDCGDSPFALRIEKTGDCYWCDQDGSQTMEAIIVRLNHGRGFLVGWTMGDNMCASLDSDIFENEGDARRVARSRCEDAAQSEMDYQESIE